MRKKICFLALTASFVLVLAASAFAQSLTFNEGYNLDGTIEMDEQEDHLSNPGAELKQTIMGEGEITNSIDSIDGEVGLEKQAGGSVFFIIVAAVVIIATYVWWVKRKKKKR